MCYGENGTVKFFETLADYVFKHNYSMMQIKKKLDGLILNLHRVDLSSLNLHISVYAGLSLILSTF
jgi:hypothetical protein